jgi:hypothetical protein
MPAAVTLPEVLVIGAMKCGTSAVHAYLDAHPDVAMSDPKELNFFNEHWDRGLEWYSSQLDPDAKVRGESSPGYTSPSFPDVPERIAGVVPWVRLVYLVRDPVQRALSQYAHHRRQGTETRPVAEALLDPDSQYVARSRFHERLAPYLQHFEREQVHVVVSERLLGDRRGEVARLYEHVGVDPTWRDRTHERLVHVGDAGPDLPGRDRAAFLERTADDTDRLRELLDDDLEEWR